MARKRKTYQEQTRRSEAQITEPVLEWPAAIYARLSVENSKKDDDGESIETQVEICRSYLEEHPYLHLFDVYMDNGWTGTNTNRPEFQRMLDDIHSGRVKAVIIKDFSRFSRDYIEAGNLLENVFPFMGVRFISVADSYDSFETDGSAESLLIPLKNLINSYYSKDISRKVSAAVHSQQMAGQHLPSQIPYGYRKSETRAYRMEPDPETADVVKRIFREFHEGSLVHTIVRRLNDEGVPSPGQIRYNRGQTVRACYKTSRWSQEGIKQILRNPTYMGDMVFGRMPTALYLGQPNYHYEKDESKWRVLSNTHEPLVSREMFYEVRKRMKESALKHEKLMNSDRAVSKKHPGVFYGYLYCGDCGAKMYVQRQRSDKDPDVVYMSYLCSRYAYRRCSSTHTISEKKLEKIVYDVVQDQLKYFCDFEKLIESLNECGRETEQQISYKEQIQSILAKIQRCMDKREHLYEDFTDHLLTPEDYISFKKKYDDEYQNLNKNLNRLQTMQSKLNRSLSKKNKWLVHMQSVKDSTKITPELLEAVIDKILVYQTGKERRVEIVFKYRDDFNILQEAYEELEGGTDQ